ncbi:MAG: hypothetical protein ABIN67_15295 [Ferruginibacter sp.]
MKRFAIRITLLFIATLTAAPCLLFFANHPPDPAKELSPDITSKSYY